MSVTKSSGSSHSSIWSRNAVFGMQGRDHDGGVDLLAVLEHHAGHPAVADHRAGDTGVDPDIGTEVAGGALHGVGHRAHAAFGEAPVPEMAVTDVADGVVGHDVGGAGLHGAGPGADDPVHRDRGLDLPRLEPVVEQVGDGHGEEAHDVGDGADIEPPVPPRQPERLGQVARLAGADVGRHGQQQWAEHVRQSAEPGVPLGHGVGVLLGPLGDRVVVLLGVVGVDLDRPALREGLVVGAHRVHLVAEPLELQVLHDRRRQETHHVRQAGHLELRGVGPRCFGGGGAARLVAALEDQRAQTGTGQVGPGDQAVVSTADHDGVVRGGHCVPFGVVGLVPSEY